MHEDARHDHTGQRRRGLGRRLARTGWLFLALLAAPLGAADAADLRLESVDFTPQELRDAIEVWRGGCAALLGPAAGLGFTVDGPSVDRPSVPVRVRRRGDSFSRHGRCGQSRVRREAGRIVEAEVDIFMHQRAGRSCYPIAGEIAHELGHLLGFADGSPVVGASVMSPRHPGELRRPTVNECLAAGRLTAAGESVQLARESSEPDASRPARRGTPPAPAAPRPTPRATGRAPLPRR